MKRVLIRMSALATVVVLGLIAIAQAQRSADHSTAVAANSSAPSTPAQAERPEPIRLSDSAAPRPLAVPARVNPLRPETAPASAAADRFPARATRQPYSQEPDAVQPLVMSEHDSTRLMAVGGPGAAEATEPGASVQPAVPSPSSGLFPLRPAMAPPTGQPQEPANN